MKRFLSYGFAVLSFTGYTELVSQMVWDCAKSNRLETWEGRYVLSDIFPVSSSNLCHDMSLYACLYRHENWSGQLSRKSGTLLEMYGSSSGMVYKVLHANENVKGVTPVLLKIGVGTVEGGDAMWLLWRHQGNGGIQRCDQYVLSNNVFDLFRQFEYCDQGNGMQWHEFKDGILSSRSLSSPETDLKMETVVWENTNTIYKAVRGTIW